METTATTVRVSTLKNVAKYGDKPSMVIIMKTDAGRIVEVALKRGQLLPEHEAPGEALIQCLEGRVNFMVEGETLAINAGEYITLSKGTPHSVEAVEDSKMLVTAINPD